MSKERKLENQPYKQILENCTCMHIRRSSRCITQYFDAVLAPAGISSTQLTLLITISHDHSQSLTKISESIGMTKSSLSHMLKPMFEQDLVETEISGNKKTKWLILTERGKLTVRLALPLWEHAQEQLVAKLGESDWQALIEKLARISQTPSVIAD